MMSSEHRGGANIVASCCCVGGLRWDSDRVRDAVPKEVKGQQGAAKTTVVGESTKQTSTVQQKQNQPVESRCASSSAVYHGRGAHFTGCEVMMGVAPLAWGGLWEVKDTAPYQLHQKHPTR